MMSWLFTTAIGRTVLLALVISITAGLTYWYIDDKAYDRGYDDAKAECDKLQSDAKTKLLNQRAAEASTGAAITAAVARAAQAKVDAIDLQNDNDKKVIDDEYRKPAGAPVAFGSCVHAVPAGVQNVIDAAVERTNRR